MIHINVYDDKREKKLHGTYEFPVAVYHYVMSDFALGCINWHWHEEIQLALVTHGKIRFSVEGAQFVLKEGEGFFVNSERLHMARWEEDPASSYLCLDFHPRLLKLFTGSLQEQHYVAPYLTAPGFQYFALFPDREEDRPVLETVRTVADMMREKAFAYEMEVSARITQLWRKLIGRADPAAASPAQSGRDTVQKIICYLQDHYQQPVTLREVAMEAGFSESECCRLFKKATGDTILSYLRSYRLTQAAELLEKGEASVSEIAYATGFSGSSYFIESFRRELGTTPMRYRKERKSTG